MHLRVSRGTGGSARKTLWLAPACLGLATGCTILKPIQLPDADRRFPLSSVANQGKAPCTPPVNATTNGECEPLEDDIDDFHEGLGRALWETDVRRRQLLAQTAAHTNINSAYNALLWPLGSYFIAKKIRHPEWRTLDVAALAAASYGFLNSGIPERDQLYVRTAARMACSMTFFDAYLYKKDEIKPQNFVSRVLEPVGQHQPQTGDTLFELVDEISWLATNFPTQQEAVLLQHKLQEQKAAATGLNPADKRRLEVKSLNSGSKAQKDPIKEFRFENDSLLARAKAQLTPAQALQGQLQKIGVRLRGQRINIETALTQGLNERTPTPQQATAVGTLIGQAFEAGMTSERKFVQRVNQQSGAARTEDWLPTPAALVDLDEPSRKRMVDFWTNERATLKRTMAGLAYWMARHDERVRLARADASSMGCSEGDLAEFTRSLSKAAEGAGASMPTPPTPGTSK